MNRQIRTLFILAIVLAVGLSALQIASSPRIAQAAGGDPANSTIGPAGPTTVQANGVATTTVTVHIATTANTPVAGDGINILPNPLPAGVTVTPGLSGTTNASGDFVITLKSTVVTNLTLTAFDSGSNFSVPGQAQINFVAPPAVDGQSTVTASPANPTPVAADNVATSTITVTLKDAGGNPTASKAVNLVAAPSTGVNIQPAPPQLTNGAGTVSFTVKSTTPNLVTFTATDTSDGFTLTSTAQVNFVAPPASASQSTVSTNKANVSADGVDKATITVTVKDAGGNLLAARPVTLASSSPSVTITPTSGGVTNGSGVATFDVSTTTPQNGIVFQASSGGIAITQTATVNFLAAPASAANSTVSASAATLPADNFTTATITVTLKDAGNNAASGKTVSLAASPSSGVTITANAGGVTNASGVATFTVKSSAVANVTFTATDTTDGVVLSAPAQKPVINFTAPLADPNQSLMGRVPGSGNIPADNTTILQIVVTLRDAGSNPIAGKLVQVTASPSAGVTITPSAAGSDTTNASGIATFNVKVLSSTTINVTFTAKDVPDNITLNNPLTVTFVPPPANDALSTVVASPTSVVADGLASSTVTVTLKDQGGNPTAGKTVALAASASGTGVTITPATVVTNASGVAAFTVKSTIPHQAPPTTFQATDQTDSFTLSSTANVTFTSSPAAVGNSTIAANPASVIANGGATVAGQSVITLVLKDAGNNPTSGKTIQLVPSPATGVTFVTSATAGTDVNGQVQFTIGSSIAQTVTFTANDLTDAISPFKTISVTFTPSVGPVYGTKSTLSASPTTLNADGAATSTITALLKDATGTVVQGKTVTLTSTPNPLPAGFTLSAASGTSNASGVVTWTIKSTVGGTVSFTGAVTSDGVILQGNPSITFNPVGSPVNATNSTVVVTGSPAPADGATAITVTVTLLDGASAPVAGKTVTLTSSRGATDTITPASGTSNASGVVTFTVKSNTPGTPQLTAVGDGITLNTKPNITFNPLGSQVDATKSTVLISASPMTADGVSKFTITVTALKADGVTPVVGVGATVSSTRAGGVDTITPAGFQNTDAAGKATFFMTSTTAGSGNVVAVADGVTLAASPSFTWNPTVSPVDPAQSTVTTSGSPAPADGVTSITVSVTLKNSVGNPIGGKNISISGSPSAGVVITPASALSDAVTGAATFQVKSTTAAGIQITAVGDGVTLNTKPVITFTALAGVTDLSLAKTGPASFTVGTQGTYTITVTNNGPAASAGTITVTDTLPTELTFVSGSGGGFTCTGGATVTCTSAGPIANGGSAAITITVNPTAANAGVTNTATLTGGGDNNAANNQASAGPIPIVSSPPDLTIVAGHNPATFTTNQIQAFTVNILNLGGPTTSPIVVTDLLPSGMTAVSWSGPSGFTCSGSSTVICTSSSPLPNLFNGQIIINVNAGSTPGLRTNTVTLTGGGDPTPPAPATDNVTVNAIDPTLSSTLSTISANPSSGISADGNAASTVTVTVKTVGGFVPTSPVTVSLAASPTTNITISPTSATTDANGTATFTVKSTAAATYTLTATVTGGNPTLTLTTTVTFITPGATPTPTAGGTAVVGTTSTGQPASTFTVDCTTVPADNVYKANLTVTLKNSSGGPVTGQSVTVAATPTLTGLLLNPTQGTSDANGQAKFTVQSPTQGTVSITATTSGVTLPAVQIIFAKPGTLANCPAPTTAATGTGGVPLTSITLLNLTLNGPSIGQVNAYRLRVRSGPGLQYQQIGTLKLKQLVVLLGRDPRGRWFLIQLDDKGSVGWVSAFYIRVRRLAFRHLPIVDVNTLILPAAPAPGVVPTATPTR